MLKTPRSTRRSPAPETAPAADTPVVVVHGTPQAAVTHLRDLQACGVQELYGLAHAEGVASPTGLSKAELVVEIARARAGRGHTLRAEGTLEVLSDGYAFLRHAHASYLNSPDDVYVSPAQVRRLGLQTGMTIEGPVRAPLERQQYLALLQVAAVNGTDPERVGDRVLFQDRTPLHPDRRLFLEAGAEDLNLRVIDLVTPVGKGQRGLIVAPPRTGKTVLLRRSRSASCATTRSAMSSCCSSTSGPRRSPRCGGWCAARRPRSSARRSTAPPTSTSASPRWRWRRPAAWWSSARTW